MASLQCGSFHVALNDHFGWITCHIWNRKIASLCGSSHVFSNHHSDWMSFDICSRQMASLLLDPFMCLQITNMVECLVTFRAGKWHLSCKSFHVSSNHHSGWMTCYIWSRQMASLQCGTFHVVLNDHFGWMTCHIWNRQMAFLCGSVDLLCVFKSPLWLNILWHLEQANGFSPLWILPCVFKSPLWLKNASNICHLEQANGFHIDQNWSHTTTLICCP